MELEREKTRLVRLEVLLRDLELKLGHSSENLLEPVNSTSAKKSILINIKNQIQEKKYLIESIGSNQR